MFTPTEADNAMTSKRKSSMPNIAYTSRDIVTHFETHRRQWNQFYPSERWVFERIAAPSSNLGSVLDVGCASGGLGLALQEHLALQRYVGIDVNPFLIDAARQRLESFRVPTCFVVGDILSAETLDGSDFDVVVSLSCADWNVETTAIIDSCWRHVAPGGYVVISLRLTPEQGINDLRRSYQYVSFGEDVDKTAERANYVVLNVGDALAMFAALYPAPEHIIGYGYWGQPSSTAVTLYSDLVFAVFAARRPHGPQRDTSTELHFPLSLWTRSTSPSKHISRQTPRS